ncbi:MAG: YbhB/YbcL family Raf kinase inhibitor-like protein [bacterium]
MKRIFSIVVLICFMAISCNNEEINIDKEENVKDITVTSTAFEHNGDIPKKYTCQGEEISPPVKWSGIPEGTKSIALISDDPDAPMGTWVHWVIFNIPPEKGGLEENIPKNDIINGGIKQGKNSGKETGYQGPCPPSGKHRYFFKVYALDNMLDIDSGISKQELLNAMEEHILGYGELIGLYEKE